MPDGSITRTEARLAQKREALAHTLDDLSQILAPDNLAQTAQDYGGELGQQAWQAARDNPAAFALVGAGLALMLSGAGTRKPPFPAPQPGAPVPPEKAMKGFDDRVARADAKIHAAAQNTRSVSAARMRAALHQGLDKLPDGTRARVLKLRKAAIDVQEKLERRTRRMRRTSSRLVNEQPVAVGAVGFGIGALIAAFVPNTQREDALLGEHRDALLAQAESVFHSCMASLGDQAQSHLPDPK